MTRFQWRVWMEEHEASFRELMKSQASTRADRSQRLQARDGLPPAIPRWQPRQAAAGPSDGWPTLLWHRDGWHGLHTDGGLHVVFLYQLRGVSSVLDCSGMQAAPGSAFVTVPVDLRLRSHGMGWAAFEEVYLDRLSLLSISPSSPLPPFLSPAPVHAPLPFVIEQHFPTGGLAPSSSSTLRVLRRRTASNFE